MRKIVTRINGRKTKEKFAFISVNAQRIRANIKSRKKLPPIRIAASQSDKKPVYAHRIKIRGECDVLYSANEPYLTCGARMIMVTLYENVEIVK